MKKTSKEFLISTIICLLPLVFGLLVYKKLPLEIPTKWYSDGTVGQYMPKEFTVFGMPLLFALINALVHFGMNTDPKRQNIGSMMKVLGKWMIPVMSVVIIPMTILWGMGYEIPHQQSDTCFNWNLICGNGELFSKNKKKLYHRN